MAKKSKKAATAKTPSEAKGGTESITPRTPRGKRAKGGTVPSKGEGKGTPGNAKASKTKGQTKGDEATSSTSNGKDGATSAKGKGRRSPSPGATISEQAQKTAAVPFRSVNADQPTRPIVWNPRRIAVVVAMRTLHATSPETAKTAGEIAARAGIPTDEVFRVKVILDIYRLNELPHNGYTKSVRPQGSRELHYYLTELGQTCEMKPPVREGDA